MTSSCGHNWGQKSIIWTIYISRNRTKGVTWSPGQPTPTHPLKSATINIYRMTSSNGNIFRVAGPLCGEFTGRRWNPLTNANDVEFWYFLWSAPWVNNREAGDFRRLRAHHDVIVMFTISELTHKGQPVLVCVPGQLWPWCSCDRRCWFLNDCCLDAPLHCFGANNTDIRQNRDTIWFTAWWRNDDGTNDVRVLYHRHDHYDDVVMGAMASQITSFAIVYSTVYSDADQRNHQSSASLAFVQGIHRGPVNSPHKMPVTWKMSLFDDVIMINPSTTNEYKVQAIPLITAAECFSFNGGCEKSYKVSAK